MRYKIPTKLFVVAPTLEFLEGSTISPNDPFLRYFLITKEEIKNRLEKSGHESVRKSNARSGCTCGDSICSQSYLR